MPGRQHPFIIDGIYHIYNKTIDGRQIFTESSNCKKLIEAMSYYRSSATVMRLSKFHRLSSEIKNYYQKQIIDKKRFRVLILAYSLMPNHFHLLLKQKENQGVSNFISKIQNSLTKHFNILNNRIGPILLHRFKSNPITTEEQLKHVSRYIHLNCYSGGLVNDLNEICNYSWSSFNEYLNPNINNGICEKNVILSLFDNKQEIYKKFVLDNADYQRTLEFCKYSSKW